MKENLIYRTFYVEQWLDDAYFLQWVKHPGQELDAVFIPMLNERSEVSIKMRTAIDLLRNMDQTDHQLSDKEVAEMWENVSNRTLNSKKLLNHYSVWKKVFLSGAAVLLLAIVGTLFIVWKNSQQVDYFTLAKQMMPNTIKDARLIIPGKGSMTLSNRMEVVLGRDGKISLRSAQGEMVSLENSVSSGKEMGMLVVPAGKRASLLLADGTKIEVRPSSQVIFPVKFGEKKRELFIQGEAFFEVSKNKHWPFVVKTDRINVEVLGTSFNVEAYSGNKEQSVVLVNGSVKVNTDGRNAIRIHPNQKYAFNEDHQIETVEDVDVNLYTSWKEGYFLFNSEKLNVVLEKLSSYYGIQFHYQEASMDNIRLSGKLDLNNSLEVALKVISTTTPIEYQLEKSYVKINVRH